MVECKATISKDKILSEKLLKWHYERTPNNMGVSKVTHCSNSVSWIGEVNLSIILVLFIIGYIFSPNTSEFSVIFWNLTVK